MHELCKTQPSIRERQLKIWGDVARTISMIVSEAILTVIIMISLKSVELVRTHLWADGKPLSVLEGTSFEFTLDFFYRQIDVALMVVLSLFTIYKIVNLMIKTIFDGGNHDH